MLVPLSTSHLLHLSRRLLTVCFGERQDFRRILEPLNLLENGVDLISANEVGETRSIISLLFYIDVAFHSSTACWRRGAYELYL